MRIGIDASRAFVDNPTGTERYSYEVITRLLKLPEAKKHTWILYVRPQFLISNFKFLNNDQMFKCPNVQIREIPLSRLWTQVGLAARTWVDDLDVLWVPAHTLPVLRKLGIRTVVTVHGLEYEWLPEYENWLQRWYLPLSTKYAVMSASRIIAVSEFTKRQLVERLGADERKIAVIHEGVTRQRLETSVQRSVIGKSMRAEKIRTYNYPQNRVTDHRLKKSWYKLDKVMEGDLLDLTNSDTGSDDDSSDDEG